MVELDNYKVELSSYEQPLAEVRDSLNLGDKRYRIEELEKNMEAPDFWDDSEKASQAMKEVKDLKDIVGRAKDMLIRGGENVYPREIEEFLFRHPKVQSVQVFGVPDTRYGEEICAWIVPKPGQTCTEDEIRDFCRDQIAHYKVPRYIRFVEDMPMTITGKVQKFVMRDQMIADLKLQVAKTA